MPPSGRDGPGRDLLRFLFGPAHGRRFCRQKGAGSGLLHRSDLLIFLWFSVLRFDRLKHVMPWVPQIRVVGGVFRRRQGDLFPEDFPVTPSRLVSLGGRESVKHLKGVERQMTSSQSV